MKSRNQGLKGKSKLQTGMILKATNGKILGIVDGDTRLLSPVSESEAP